METFVLPAGTKIYDYMEVPRYLYYLIDGIVETKLFNRTMRIETGALGEWALFNLPSQEQVVSVSEVTLFAIKPDEIYNFEHTGKALKNIIPSVAARLLLIDSELTESQEIPTYVGPDRMRFFNKVHPGAYKITDSIFQDMLQVKSLYAAGYYKEAYDVIVKLMPQTINEELRKEIMIWHTLLSMILEPEKADVHFRRLSPKDYSEHLSYLYLTSFYKGGEKQEILEIYMKAGLHLPSETIVTLEGEVATEAFLVLKGYLKAVKLFEDREVLMSIVGPGEFVGEGAIMNSKTRMATLYSISPTDIIPLSTESIEKAALTNPGFILKICESQLRRIMQVKQLLEIKSQSNQIQRTIMAINYFKPIFGKAKVSVRDIAYLVDVNVERVIEEVKRMGYKIGIDGSIGV
ncbi:Cyclic nucleotide-binding domain-containing protein [Fervidobacterium changbaicum]|uniref:Crp/Fnr family transcriptional regulator n=1 Tax=Fervidobacterium changbaicum TaxID=310769 RepID=A0AAE6CDN6_9BACT|nr:Crp/Fnr family transcriptional regulator [Fervidobacterium changbaicum]QAV33263.1 Crp/Fnr family transcriptional regulator [Fervidobacterium changbaicum]SDH06437.1 Cyclic nucleotide-binding domain-containing protein [Fervidobacterium changbaicum]